MGIVTSLRHTHKEVVLVQASFQSLVPDSFACSPALAILSMVSMRVRTKVDEEVRRCGTREDVNDKRRAEDAPARSSFHRRQL